VGARQLRAGTQQAAAARHPKFGIHPKFQSEDFRIFSDFGVSQAVLYICSRSFITLVMIVRFSTQKHVFPNRGLIDATIGCTVSLRDIFVEDAPIMIFPKNQGENRRQKSKKIKPGKKIRFEF
jgi:hypothetical protein